MVEQTLDSMIKLMKNQDYNPIRFDCTQSLDLILDNSFKNELIKELSENTISNTSLFIWDSERLYEYL